MAEDKSRIKPRFQLEKLKGKHKRVILKPTDTGFEETVVEEPAGWMVYLPSGISYYVRTEDELERLGLTDAPDLVDMETGDVVGTTQVQDLKAIAEQKSARNQRRGSGSLTA
jgi:hypothetical protein